MTLRRAAGVRNERLDVRLTAEEASYIADTAAERSVTISDFIRNAVFQGTGFHAGGSRRVMARDHADTVRSLNAIGVHLRNLANAMRMNGTVTAEQIESCVGEMRTALARFEL
jgi:uncharacterized protein (DUF1778 family)